MNNQDNSTPYFNGVYHAGNIQTKIDANGNEIVTTVILGREIMVKSFRGIPVLSFQDIAELLEPANSASVYNNLKNNFRNNQQYFRDGIDYFMIKPEHLNGADYVISKVKYFDYSNQSQDQIRNYFPDSDQQQVLMLPQARSIGITVANRGTIYLTETGFSLAMKSISNPKAYYFIRDMIDGYFMARDKLAGISTPAQDAVLQQQMFGRIKDMDRKVDALYDAISEMRSISASSYYMPLNGYDVDRLIWTIKAKLMDKLGAEAYGYVKDDYSTPAFKYIEDSMLRAARHILDNIMKEHKYTFTYGNLNRIYEAIEKYDYPDKILAFGNYDTRQQYYGRRYGEDKNS